MIAWWWSVILFLAGFFVGVILMGVCSAGYLHTEKEWQKDEQRENG